MTAGPHFRIDLLPIRGELLAGRERLREQHVRGASAGTVCARLTDLLDTAVLALWELALADLKLEDMRAHVALVPHGGYGRRDVAPFSDVDLMILHDGSRPSDVAPLATRIMQDLYDIGLSPGHSVRTPAQAWQLVRGDATICTSLIEARFLAGAEPVYRTFSDRFAQMMSKRFRTFFEAIDAARRTERRQFGETVYLLRPNIKRSRGGLRDMQLLRWVGFARFGTADPDALLRQNALSREDRRVLRSASEFLLRVRNEMHFNAGNAQDVLDRAEQVRLAALYGYPGAEGLLPVEQFMRDYFQHTSEVRNLVSRFVNSVRPRGAMRDVLAPMFSHQIEGDYRVGPFQISATRQGLAKLKTDLGEVLRLADLANLYDKRIDHATWETVCRSSTSYPVEISDDTARRFLSLLSQPAQLGELLRRLHELGVLERIVPAFAHARCLLQFNDYHKYTVDEHCIRAVEGATNLMAERGPLADAYREIQPRRVLHLALLLHDLGKGFAEDHTEVGLRIADETTRRLKMPEREAKMVRFLVHRHLSMTHLAFRRDTSDDQLVLRFAAEVGTPEGLRMLYVMSCADLAAVGPGSLNSWKIDVLTELYGRVMRHLTGEATLEARQALGDARKQVQLLLKGEFDDWAKTQIEGLPASYLYAVSPARIVEMLGRLRRLKPRAADSWGLYLPENETLVYTAIVDQGHGRGVFSRLTGALSAQGLEILSADINSLAGETILDRFVVHDPDFTGAPPPERIEAVCQALTRSIDQDEPPRFRRLWATASQDATSVLVPIPTRVRFDNSTSAAYTILDVFTCDRRGLLYTIARTLLELGLSIATAKISTYLDQVVDVFYITDQVSGRKIENEVRLEEIRARLLTAIEAMSAGK